MRRLSLFATALVALVAFGTVAALAQRANTIEPVPYVAENCLSERYDIDESGAVDKDDVLAFEEIAMIEGNCLDNTGQPVPDGTCDDALDVDGNGVVTLEDHTLLYRHVFTCMFPSSDESGGR